MFHRAVLALVASIKVTISCAQGEWELYQKAQDAYDTDYCAQALHLCDSLVGVGLEINQCNYYYLRAQAKRCLHDYPGSLEDVDRSLQLRSNFCGALDMRAELNLRAGKRSEACIDWSSANALCVDHYKRQLDTHCDPDWDYAAMHKVHRSDTTAVLTVVEAYYVGCQQRISDTTYCLKSGLTDKGEWEIYFDEALTRICTRLSTREDTLFSYYYYPNGQLKDENREVDSRWVYSAEWCENGQIIHSGIVNITVLDTSISYYCNGQRKWQAVLWQGRAWGTEASWYENGQLKSELHYTKFDPVLAAQGKLDNQLLSENYWDEGGKPIDRPVDVQTYRINNVGAPIHIDREKLNGATPYYDVEPSPHYNAVMRRLSDQIYATAKLTCSSDCKVGQVYIDFLIDKEGRIKNTEVTRSLDACVDQVFVDAIRQLGSWSIGKVQGVPVDVHVSIGFELERLKR